MFTLYFGTDCPFAGNTYKRKYNEKKEVKRGIIASRFSAISSPFRLRYKMLA
jgi:hypothetical protein|tara:strand:+ start:4745 stop:4900 length:156 start_codon:yes stop_codon:yes gene_type:complete